MFRDFHSLSLLLGIGSATFMLTLVASGSPAATAPPPPPTVTTSGLYTASLTEISAQWTAFDPEANVDPASNIVFCALDIHRGSSTGPVILTYGLACGTFTGVLFVDLSLD